MNFKNFYNALLSTSAIFGLAGVALGAPAALAQSATTTATTAPVATGQLQEVVVTAEHRTTDLQKTASSITAITGQSIQQTAKANLYDVTQGVPALVMQNTSTGFAVAIRGLGLDTSTQLAGPAVASYYDGVYSDAADGGLIGFYDINRVEVLRGPQGTLYGRNAEAGVLNIITNDPKLGKFGGDVSAGIGNYGLIEANGALNVPLGDNFAARVAFNTTSHNGYFNNGQSDDDEKSVRLKLLYQYSPNTKIVIGTEYSRDNGAGPGTAPLGANNTSQIGQLPSGSAAFVTDNLTPNIYNFEQWKVYARADMDLGFAVLSIIPSTQQLREYNLSNLPGPFVIEYGGHEQQTSTEARLENEPGSHIIWDLGLYYYTKNDPDTSTLPVLELSNEMVTAEGAYGQATVPFTNWLRGTVGVRESRDALDTVLQYPAFQPSPVSFDKAFTHFDSKLELEADVGPHSLLYAQRATGYRPGGLYAPNASSVYESETNTTYEVGSKNRFLDNSLQVNGDVYYSQTMNYQAAAVAFVGGAPLTTVSNLGGTTQSIGVETESILRPTPYDQVNLNVTYMHSQLPGDVPLGALPNEPMPHSPTWQIRLALQHVFDLGDYGSLTPRADVTYQTSNYLSYLEEKTPTIQDGYYTFQPAYTLENASLLYDLPSNYGSLSLWVRNISNVVTKTQVILNGPPNDISGSSGVTEPRTYGANYTISF